MKRMLIAVFLLLSFVVNADEFELTYAEGMVQQKDGTEWIDLVTGDMVKENETIRVGTDALAEFEGEINGNSFYFSIIDEGIYIIKDFVVSSRESQKSGLLNFVSTKMSHLLDDSYSSEAAMGVRGYEWDDLRKETLWASAEYYLIYGIVELEKGDDIYRAMVYLEDSLEEATEEEEPEIYYYMGLAYYQDGLKTKAMKILEKASPVSDKYRYKYYYNDYALLLGSLYMYSNKFKRAIQVLEKIDEEALAKGDKQNLYLIKGISFFKLGKKQKAKEYLTIANELDKESMAGESAAEMLKNLR